VSGVRVTPLQFRENLSEAVSVLSPSRDRRHNEVTEIQGRLTRPKMKTLIEDVLFWKNSEPLKERTTGWDERKPIEFRVGYPAKLTKLQTRSSCYLSGHTRENNAVDVKDHDTENDLPARQPLLGFASSRIVYQFDLMRTYIEPDLLKNLPADRLLMAFPRFNATPGKVPTIRIDPTASGTTLAE
jgi:hypothetical protein